MSTLDFWRRIIAKVWTYPVLGGFASDPSYFARAKSIVQYYYFSLTFLAISTSITWSSLGLRKNFSPLWPVSWANFFELPTVVGIVMVFLIAGTLLGSLFYTHRLARILVFLSVFQFHALHSSFGQPTHQWYLWLYTSLLLIFLPDRWGNAPSGPADRLKFLTIFWGAQAFVLLTYSMSGLGKVLGALDQIWSGNQIHAFSLEAMAFQIADWLPRMQSVSTLGPFIINHPWVGWPFYVGSIYLTFFSFWAAFKPSLHRMWGVGLVLFHIGTYLAMEILFLPPILLLIVLFFDSPFRNRDTNFSTVLGDLPLFGWLLRRLLFRQSRKIC